jgi:hypothetical protein
MDWPDEKAIQPFNAAMKDNSRLLIFEPLIKKEKNRIEIFSSLDGGRAMAGENLVCFRPI